MSLSLKSMFGFYLTNNQFLLFTLTFAEDHSKKYKIGLWCEHFNNFDCFFEYCVLNIADGGDSYFLVCDLIESPCILKFHSNYLRKKPLSTIFKLNFPGLGWNQREIRNRNSPHVNMLLTFSLILWIPKPSCYPKIRPTVCEIMVPLLIVSLSPPDDNMRSHKNIRWYLSPSFHSICYCSSSFLLRILATKRTKKNTT